MSKQQIVITSNDFYDDAKSFHDALKGEPAFIIDDPNTKYDYEGTGAVYVVRSATAGCAFFDAEGSFSDNLLRFLNKIVETGRVIGFVLCYFDNGERPQRSFKKLISNQSELLQLSSFKNVFFMEHLIHKPTWGLSTFSLKPALKWERKNGLVRMWLDPRPKYTSIRVRIEGLPASSGKLKWQIAHDNGADTYIGDIQYEKSGKADPVRAKGVGYEWLIFEQKRGGHFIEFDVHIDENKNYSNIQFLFSEDNWQAESDLLELKHESKAERDARRVTEIVNSLGADSSEIAKELTGCLELLKKINRRDIGKVMQELLDIDNHEQILTELQKPTVVPMEN